MKYKKQIIILLILIVVIVVDQILKINSANLGQEVTIFSFLKFTYVENTGGAFGIANNNIVMFILVNFIILGIITKFILTKLESLNKKTIIGLSFILSGGISNLIDRIFRGKVIDYIDINSIIKYPVFNLADVFVIIGCIILAIEVIIHIKKQEK